MVEEVANRDGGVNAWQKRAANAIKPLMIDDCRMPIVGIEALTWNKKH